MSASRPNLARRPFRFSNIRISEGSRGAVGGEVVVSPRPTMSEEGAAPPVPSFPEKCNIKDAKTVLLKMIVDAENDGEMKAELPLLQKWLEDQHADEVRHGKMRCARRDAASLHMASIHGESAMRFHARPSETGPAPPPAPLPPCARRWPSRSASASARRTRG